jgi:hypothetical protein
MKELREFSSSTRTAVKRVMTINKETTTMRTENLHIKLAESNGKDIGMKVQIWRSRSGKSWGFTVEPDLEFDISMYDRVFHAYCDLAGFDDKFDAVWESLPYTRYVSPSMLPVSPVYTYGKNFVSREDVMSLLEQAYYPVWKAATARTIAYDRGQGWLDTIDEACKRMDWEAYHQFQREHWNKQRQVSQQ